MRRASATKCHLSASKSRTRRTMPWMPEYDASMRRYGASSPMHDVWSPKCDTSMPEYHSMAPLGSSLIAQHRRSDLELRRFDAGIPRFVPNHRKPSIFPSLHIRSSSTDFLFSSLLRNSSPLATARNHAGRDQASAHFHLTSRRGELLPLDVVSPEFG